MITDFDGTLVNTFEANLKAYTDAFRSVGLELIPSVYRMAYGSNFNDFMNMANVPEDCRSMIASNKSVFYRTYFNELVLNERLVSLLAASKNMGVRTGVATMASRANVDAVMEHFGLSSLFDLVLTGDDVRVGKPDPLIYKTAMDRLGVEPGETLVFEDGDAGIESALRSGANYIKVKI